MPETQENHLDMTVYSHLKMDRLCIILRFRRLFRTFEAFFDFWPHLNWGEGAKEGKEGGGEGRKRSLESGEKPTETLAAHAKKLMGKGRNRRRHAGYHKS